MALENRFHAVGWPARAITLQPVDASRLASLALAYSKGFVTWNQVSEETGIGFGDLLVALGSQNLQLPKVVAKRTPTQDGFYRQILDAAKASQGLGQ